MDIVAVLLFAGLALLVIGLLRGNIRLKDVTIKEIPTLPSILLAVIGLIAIFGAVYLYLRTNTPVTAQSDSAKDIQALETEIASIKAQLESSQQQVDNLKSDIQSLSQIPDQSKVSLEINRLDNSLTDVKNRMTKIEQVIMDDPVKALEIPLIQKDLESTKALYDSRLLSIEQSVSQIYNLILGVLVVIGLGFLGIAASNLWSAKKSKDEGNSK